MSKLLCSIKHCTKCGVFTLVLMIGGHLGSVESHLFAYLSDEKEHSKRRGAMPHDRYELFDEMLFRAELLLFLIIHKMMCGLYSLYITTPSISNSVALDTTSSCSPLEGIY